MCNGDRHSNWEVGKSAVFTEVTVKILQYYVGMVKNDGNTVQIGKISVITIIVTTVVVPQYL